MWYFLTSSLLPFCMRLEEPLHVFVALVLHFWIDINGGLSISSTTCETHVYVISLTDAVFTYHTIFCSNHASRITLHGPGRVVKIGVVIPWNEVLVVHVVFVVEFFCCVQKINDFLTEKDNA